MTINILRRKRKLLGENLSVNTPKNATSSCISCNASRLAFVANASQSQEHLHVVILKSPSLLFYKITKRFNVSIFSHYNIFSICQPRRSNTRTRYNEAPT